MDAFIRGAQQIMLSSHRHALFSLAAAAVLGAVALAAAPEQGPAATTAADRLASFATRQQMEKASILQNLKFRNIGPVEMNGRIVDIEFPDPRSPYTYLIAYASGGLWKTTNNGVTFEPIFDDQPTLIMGDVAVDPKNPTVYWVGTGEKNASRSTYAGTGVFRTADGGKSWTPMGLADTHRISKIVVSPADSRAIWVAAQGPLYTDSEHRGVYKSIDGGKTWKKTLFVDAKTGASDIAIHPANPRILYAAMWTKDRKAWKFTPSGGSSGVWKSEDGGEKWTKLAGGLPSGDFVGRIGLGVSAAAPNVVYASIDSQAPKPDQDQPPPSESPLAPEKLRTMTEEQFLTLKDPDIQTFLRRFHPDDTVEQVRGLVKSGKLTVKGLLDRLLETDAGLFDKDILGAQLYRSSDAGRTWTLQHSDYLDNVYSTYGYYFGDITVSPKDANTMYLFGVPLLKTTDGGKTWKAVGSRAAHSDHHALWIDPNHPDHIVNGNDGGLNVSWDGGKTFTDVVNVPVGQFYNIAVDMAEPYNVYGGLQDNGVYVGPSDRTYETNRWRAIGGGDGMQVQVDTRTNKLYVRGSQYGNYRATDETANKSWTVRPLGHVTEPSNRYNWQSPILFSPHTPEILYFGTQRLNRSFDQGRTFRAISGDLTTNRQPNWSDTPYSTLVTISESPLRLGLIYTGSDDGLVHVTRDGGGTWTNVTAGLAKDRYVSRVIASQHDAAVAYAAQTGYRNDDWTGYLFRTSDYGKTWTSITGNLPAEPINVIKEDPKVASILYVGTDIGAYVSLDTGRTWQPLVGGLPHVPVHDLLVHPRDLDIVLGTHGRSIYITSAKPIHHLLEPAVAGQAKRVMDLPLHLYKIDDVKIAAAYARDTQRKRPSWMEAPSPAPAEFLYWAQAAGPVTLTIRDENGNAVRVLKDEAEAGINVVRWDLTLDVELAKKAEESLKTKPKKAFEPWMTWFAELGGYSLEIAQGAQTDKASFKVVRGAAAPSFFDMGSETGR